MSGLPPLGPWLENFICGFEKTFAQRRVLLAAKRGEFLKFATLFCIEARRYLDNQTCKQIATIALVDVRNSFAAQFEDLPALRTRGNFQMRFAFQCRHVELAAQSRERKRDRHLAIKIIAVALKDFVLLDMNDDIKVSRWAATDSSLAIASLTQ